MKKLKVILPVLVVVLLFAACTDRRMVYERRSPVYLDTPEPTRERDWSVSETEEPVSTPEPDRSAEATPELPFKFTGYAYCVINGSTGEVLIGENSRARNYIASITKLLTALTALDWMSTSETVTVGSGWLDLLRTESGIDSFGIVEGDDYNVGDLLNMALVRSFGDAAIVLGKIAEERSGRSFLDLMNEKAQNIGMDGSRFDNVIGLDVGNNFFNNYSTAEDAAKLMAEALKNEEVMKACCGKDVTLTNGNVINNTSAFLTAKRDGASYTVIGGKTGYTKAAGSNLAVAVRSNITGTVFVVAYIHGIGMNVLGGEIHEMLEYLCAREVS